MNRFVKSVLVFVTTIIPTLILGEINHSPYWFGDNALAYNLIYTLPPINGQDVIPHDPGKYAYCRWGNYIPNDSTILSWYYISRLTSKPFEDDLFLSNSKDQLGRVPFPVNTSWPEGDWPPNDRTAPATIPEIGYQKYGSLFRYLHFENNGLRDVGKHYNGLGKVDTNLVQTLDPYTGDGSPFDYENLPESAGKIVVLIHGWNPGSNPSGYFDTNSSTGWGGNFAVLTRALQNALNNTDWHLTHYNWSVDSDTGPIEANAINGTEAAEIGTQHGWHLGKFLEDQIIGLRKLHLIAHSAGSWVAWASAYYVLQRMPDVTVQITLLDPFMPDSVVGISSSLGVPTMEQFGTLNGGDYRKLFQMENYWADDFFARGTNTEDFNFRSAELSGLEDVNFLTETLLKGYPGHSGPIQFFADTVINSMNPGQIYPDELENLPKFDEELHGWQRSMAFLEQRFGGFGFPNAIIFRTGDCFQKSYGWMSVYEGQKYFNHAQHGWQYSLSGDFETGLYIWDQSLKAYYYTRADCYPAIYSFIEGFEGWCWYYEDEDASPGNRRFYNFDLDLYQTEEQLTSKESTVEGFSLINSGSFTMGSPINELGRDADETQHSVTLTRSFFLQQLETSLAEWRAVRDWALSNGYSDIPAGGAGRYKRFPNNPDSHPVTNVHWYDCIKWCNARSEMEGLTPCYTVAGETYREGKIVPDCDFDANGYRLPTEAEWEYACRAGTTTAFYTGEISQVGWEILDPNLDLAGWYRGNNPGQNSKPGGQKQSNSWGLYDMLGNALEICWDRYAPYPTEPITDPIVEGSSGSDIVTRGGRGYGGGGDWAKDCRSAQRFSIPDTWRWPDTTIRPARTYSKAN